MSEVNIEWKGLSPSDETRAKMEDVLKTLNTLLPPDSDIKLHLEKYPKHYEGNIVVRSALGDFAAQERHKDPLALCKLLRKVLKHQIFKYRQTHLTWQRAA